MFNVFEPSLKNQAFLFLSLKFDPSLDSDPLHANPRHMFMFLRSPEASPLETSSHGYIQIFPRIPLEYPHVLPQEEDSPGHSQVIVQ